MFGIYDINQTMDDILSTSLLQSHNHPNLYS